MTCVTSRPYADPDRRSHELRKAAPRESGLKSGQRWTALAWCLRSRSFSAGSSRPTTASRTVILHTIRIDGGIQSSGLRGLTWDLRDQDGRTAAAGVYLARLRVADARLERRFVVAR